MLALWISLSVAGYLVMTGLTSSVAYRWDEDYFSKQENSGEEWAVGGFWPVTLVAVIGYWTLVFPAKFVRELFDGKVSERLRERKQARLEAAKARRPKVAKQLCAGCRDEVSEGAYR